ncbi:MAG TPA: class II fructose-bisphosphate aldolase [bacterium]|jgi:ketose-bisphosphate aldolase|nr:class II fructose-bisphosphate aldolase [bacterium]
MLTDVKALYTIAREAGAALAAFNVYGLDVAQAVLQAAEELKCPVVIQTGATVLDMYTPFPLSEALVRGTYYARVPVACHLDHAKGLGPVIVALRAGYTSVMVDGSDLPFERNVTLTAQIVEVAHSVGVPVEGELGSIAGLEDAEQGPFTETYLTDPIAAFEFCKRTGVDALAVSIGNVHGRYEGEPRLDFDRLGEIADRVKIPLVLHGCSGLSAADLERVISLGILKTNFNTELRQAYYEGLRFVASSSTEASMRELHELLVPRVRSVVKEKLRMLGWR